MTLKLSKEVVVDFPGGTMRLFLRGQVTMTLTAAELQVLKSHFRKGQIRDLAEGEE